MNFHPGTVAFKVLLIQAEVFWTKAFGSETHVSTVSKAWRDPKMRSSTLSPQSPCLYWGDELQGDAARIVLSIWDFVSSQSCLFVLFLVVVVICAEPETICLGMQQFLTMSSCWMRYISGRTVKVPLLPDHLPLRKDLCPFYVTYITLRNPLQVICFLKRKLIDNLLWLKLRHTVLNPNLWSHKHLLKICEPPTSL